MLTLPPPHTLIAFESAARHGSFLRAGEALCITPSAVSHRIKALEDWLGQALFLRINRKIELTAAGATYLAEVRPALERIDAASRQLRRQTGQTLRISVAPAFGAKWLVGRLAGYQQTHPSLEFTLSASTRLDPMLDGTADLGLRYGRPPWPGLSAFKLSDETVTPLCTPALAATLKTPADLARVRLLRHPLLPWQPWFAAAGLDWPAPESGPEFDDAMMMLEAAAAGSGVALSVGLLARSYLVSGALVAPFDVAVPGLGFYAVLPPAAANQAWIRDFVRWLQLEVRTPQIG
ncbi:LysR substrate-binding domain-containing protein [Zoogloeaceae bacterium G21618-S1]|nr:LysR substrate-binding domain-containing protein [Zoogloeaceae bacterium G21618-S1]